MQEDETSEKVAEGGREAKYVCIYKTVRCIRNGRGKETKEFAGMSVLDGLTRLGREKRWKVSIRHDSDRHSDFQSEECKGKKFASFTICRPTVSASVSFSSAIPVPVVGQYLPPPATCWL